MSDPLLFAAAILAAAPAPAAPLAITNRVAVIERTTAADGSVATKLVPAARAVPGDRLVVTIAYRNTGTAALSGIVLANPVPAGLAYRGPAPGKPEPEVSADGTGFAPLARLAVAGRPATIADVVQVRWRLPGPLAPGAGGEVAFEAVLR